MPSLIPLLELTRTRLPCPFSTLAGELLYELSAPTPDPVRTFLLQVDLFEAGVAFLGFVQLAQLDALQHPPTASAAAAGQLRNNPRLCTGHWWALLRETSRDVHGVDERKLTEAAKITRRLSFDEAGRVAPVARLLDAVPGFRNRIKGHSWTLAPEQYEAAGAKLGEITEALLDALRPFETVSVLYVEECSPGEDQFVSDVRFLDGDFRRPTRGQVRTKGMLGKGRVVVIGRADLALGVVPAGGVLDLHPFVQIRHSPSQPDALYLWIALEDKEATLASVVGGLTLRCERSGAEGASRLDALIRPAQRSREGAVKLRERALELARSALLSDSASASYSAERYLVRPRVVQAVEGLGAGEARVSLLAGSAGTGKTALCCHLLDRWRLAEQSDEVCVAVFAPDLRASGERLSTWWQRHVERGAEGLDLAASREVLAESGARLRLLVDGVDRLGDPAGFFEEVARLVQDDRHKTLRVLLTATDAVAAELDASPAARSLGSQLQFRSLPPLRTEEALRLYSLMSAEGSEAEAPPLPTGALLEALTSPLLVRLARTRRPGVGGVARTPGQLLRAYTEQVLFKDPIRAEVAMRIVERVLDLGERAVPIGALLEDDALRAALWGGGEEGPLRALLRDHVLLLERAPSSAALPLPDEVRLSFAFDLLLEYLAFVTLQRRYAGRPEAMAQRLRTATLSGPWVGALRVQFVEALLSASPGDDGIPPNLLTLFIGLPDALRAALLTELFAANLPADDGSRWQRWLQALLDALPQDARAGVHEAALRAFDRLERRGQGIDAVAMARLVFRVHPSRTPAGVALRIQQATLETDAIHADLGVETARVAVDEAVALGDVELEVQARWTEFLALRAAGRRTEARQRRSDLKEHARTRPALPERAAIVVALTEAEEDTAFEALAARARAVGDATLVYTVLSVWCRQRLAPSERSAGMKVDRKWIKLGQRVLEAAQQLGSPRCEASAHRLLAWAQAAEPRQEAAWLERGLDAADAARSPSARANLLSRRATLRLRVARFDEAEQDAAEAARLFEELGYRYARLKVLQGVIAIAAWEGGRPGVTLNALRQAFAGLQELGGNTLPALGALLLSQMACEAGQAAQARQFLALARELHEQSAHRSLCFDLAEGRLLELEGRTGEAREAYLRAREYGRRVEFADFVFQPAILLARSHLAANTEKDRDEARVLLREMLEGAGMAEEQRDRYMGEIQTLYAYLHILEGNLEDARVWGERAAAWYEARPNHRSAAEARAVLAILAASESRRLKQGPDADKVRKRADGLLMHATKRVKEEVLPAIDRLASSFTVPEERAGYRAHHPATLLLERHADLFVATPASRG